MFCFARTKLPGPLPFSSIPVSLDVVLCLDTTGITKGRSHAVFADSFCLSDPPFPFRGLLSRKMYGFLTLACTYTKRCFAKGSLFFWAGDNEKIFFLFNCSFIFFIIRR